MGAGPINSLLIEVPDAEKIDVALIEICAFGHTRWDRHSRRKVWWIQLLYTKHVAMFMRIHFKYLSELDPLKQFLDWDIIKMAVLILHKSGDTAEGGIILDKYRCIYNADWPAQELVDEVVTKHYVAWGQREQEKFSRWVHFPNEQQEMSCFTRPNQDEYRIDSLIGQENTELRRWIDKWRRQDRLKQHGKYKSYLKISKMKMDEKVVDIYGRLDYLEKYMDNERREQENRRREELDRQDAKRYTACTVKLRPLKLPMNA